MHLHPNSIVHPMRGDIPAEIAVMFNPLGAGVRWAAAVRRRAPRATPCSSSARASAASPPSWPPGTSAPGSIIATGLARDANKLELAREFGADHMINVEEEDTVDRVRELTGGDGVDVVLDLTPMAQQPILDAIDAVRWGGRSCWPG